VDDVDAGVVSLLGGIILHGILIPLLLAHNCVYIGEVFALSM
jgi:hypothetical protein